MDTFFSLNFIFQQSPILNKQLKTDHFISSKQINPYQTFAQELF
jgi:hypothetical protein